MISFCTPGIQSFNGNIYEYRLNNFVCCFVLRTNDHKEFTTCTNSNPVVTDSYDSLNTTAIGMYGCVV